MRDENYFLKLLGLDTEKGCFLLYGFCCATSQPCMTWHVRKEKKNGRKICRAILSADEKNAFLDALGKKGRFNVGDVLFSLPRLSERLRTISGGSDFMTTGPVRGYSTVTEFWNTEKEELFNTIKRALPETDGDMSGLCAWLREKCGVDFRREGYRLGNFEVYEKLALQDEFEIVTHGECGLKRVTVRKRYGFTQDFVINCISDGRGRVILDRTKLFRAEENEIVFTAEEPMSQYIVKIWDEKTGELVFAKDFALIMGVEIGVNFRGVTKNVTDPWSEKLKKSASNRTETIEKRIETVEPCSEAETLHVRSDGDDVLDRVFEEGCQLFKEVGENEEKGAFIYNSGKDGEIESFGKLREYMEQERVERVVLADPYFAEEASGKLLGRISREDVRVEILTSLSGSEEKGGKMIFAVHRYRDFLKRNKDILHGKLRVINVTRGGKPAFHDRYLLRYWKDGKLDGFLLSNSVNSMGQLYPFVIAPLERKVCLAVSDYLSDMCDVEKQEKAPKQRRVKCEVLFDSEEKDSPIDKNFEENPRWVQWISAGKDPGDSGKLTKEEWGATVKGVFARWESEKEDACRALGFLAGVYDGWSVTKVAEMLAEAGMGDDFAGILRPLAEKAEETRKRQGGDSHSSEFTWRKLLSGEAELCRAGVTRLFEETLLIFYSGNTWLRGAYNLLLRLHPQEFLEWAEELKSPLMLDVLVFGMLNCRWDSALYELTASRRMSLLQLLAAEWMLYALREGHLKPDEAEKLLMNLPVGQRALGLAHLISESAFLARMKRENSKKLTGISRCFLPLLADTIHECTEKEIETALYWLYDCEPCSRCKLHLRLAALLSDEKIREAALDKALKIARNAISNQGEGDAAELIDLYLDAMEARYGEEAERKFIKDFISREIFENAVEPSLGDYAYRRWSDAYFLAQRQLSVLQEWKRRHPESEKAGKWLTEWGDRMECVEEEGRDAMAVIHSKDDDKSIKSDGIIGKESLGESKNHRTVSGDMSESL